MTLSAGQFCTKPGLVFVPQGSAGNALVAELARLVSKAATATALNAGIEAAFRVGTAEMGSSAGVSMVGQAVNPNSEGYRLQPTVLSVCADQLRERLVEECFGPVTVVVRYADGDDLLAAIRRLPGSLTARSQRAGRSVPTSQYAPCAAAEGRSASLERLPYRSCRYLGNAARWPVAVDNELAGILRLGQQRSAVSFARLPGRTLRMTCCRSSCATTLRTCRGV